MPPRRPLPDLCLIAVFALLTPNDQLKASKMSPRCAVLVRAANRRVKMLVITRSEDFDGEKCKNRFNFYSLASRPSMQLLSADDSDGAELSFADYPMTTARISKWNCLLLKDGQLLDLPTIILIANAFSAVTDLKFFKYDSTSCENLISLLQLTVWGGQLTQLTVASSDLNDALPDQSTDHRLIAAINTCLPALQFLALDWFSGLELPDMSILAQLQMIAIDVLHWRNGTWAMMTFLRSLERHVANNEHLLVCFFASSKITFLKAALGNLSEPVSSRIVRYDDRWNFSDFNFEWLIQFSSLLPLLTSLCVGCIKAPPQLDELLTALLEFPKLVNLRLALLAVEEKEAEPLPACPQTQVLSIRALELSLVLQSHSHLEWFNLQMTLPQLQSIHLWGFQCASCNVHLNRYLCGVYDENSIPNALTAFKCLRTTLPLLHPGVPHCRIILGYNTPYPTLQQLLSSGRQ